MQHVVSFFFLMFYSSPPSFLFMQHLKIGSLNIHGGRDANKRALMSEGVQENIDVLFSQETHTTLADKLGVKHMLSVQG